MNSLNHQLIRDQIELITTSWREQDYIEIGNCVSVDVVIAPPGTDKRIHGREAYVQSYRDYDSAATTTEFIAGEPEIDVMGNSAVAICPFTIVYEMNGQTYREAGRDILVLSHLSGKWLVIWRTMLTNPN